jgi:hypothetical protein
MLRVGRLEAGLSACHQMTSTIATILGQRRPSITVRLPLSAQGYQPNNPNIFHLFWQLPHGSAECAQSLPCNMRHSSTNCPTLQHALLVLPDCAAWSGGAYGTARMSTSSALREPLATLRAFLMTC